MAASASGCKRADGTGQQTHLVGVADAAACLGLFDDPIDEAGPDLDEGDGFVERLEGPCGDQAGEALAQTVQDGQAGKDLAANGARAGELPAREAALRLLFDRAAVGEGVVVGPFGPWQAGNIVIGATIAPERADAIAERSIDKAGDVETVVGLGAVFDMSVQPAPDGERVIGAGKCAGEAIGIGEGEVEADEEATVGGGLGFDEVGE